MGDRLLTTLITLVSAIIAVAIIAILVSRNSQTPAVLNAGGNAFATILNSAFGGAYGLGIGGAIPPVRITI